MINKFLENQEKCDTVPYANSIFEQPWYLNIVAEGKWHVVYAKDKSGKIIARLPYVEERKKITNPRFTQTLGIWMDESIRECQRGNSHLHKQKKVINELMSQLPTGKSVSITLDNSVNYILPFRWLGFSITPTFSYRISGLQQIQNIDKLIGKKTLQRIVKASEKVAVVVENTDFGISEMVSLIDSSFVRQGRKNPIPRELARRMMAESIKRNHGTIMLAKDEEGVFHSGAFFLYEEGKTCYYIFGGQRPEYKADGSQDLVLWRGIEFAKTVSENFDFEGSMVEGIEHFFSQFGGGLVTNYHISKQSLLYGFIDLIKSRVKRALGYKI